MLTFIVFFTSLLLLIVAIIALSIRILLKKNGRFPDTHIGHNPNMRKRGIVCVVSWDKQEQKLGRESKKIDKTSLRLDFQKHNGS